MPNPHLPIELIFELLSVLPVKSLLRFKSVSKSWYALIETPEFIKAHVNRSKDDKIMLRGLPDSSKRRICHIYVADCDSPDNFHTTLKERYSPIPSNFRESEIKIVGSCNGLICMKYSNYEVVLGNPLTGKHWKVPSSPFQEFFYNYRFNISYGFGYDDANDDYKVVRLVKEIESRYSNISFKPRYEVKIYSLKSNSWRTSSQDFPYRAPIWNWHYGVQVEGGLHWMLEEHDGSIPYGSVVGFDLRTEEYYLLPPPEFPEGHVPAKLDVLKGCLCVISTIGREPGRSGIGGLWMMKDYGIKGSWTKLIEGIPLCLTPIIFTKDEKELIILKQVSDELIWCEIEAKKIIKVSDGKRYGSADEKVEDEIGSSSRNILIKEAFAFKESLVKLRSN